MEKTYFIIKLENAVYNIQRVSGKTGLKSVYRYRPCCIAENGFILGVNDACENFDISINEPVKEALLKCADLYVETPRYVILKKASAEFLEICSRFGIAKLISFDECLLEIDNLPETEIHSFTSAVRESISNEMKIDSDIQLYKDYNKNLNPYSASVSWNDYAPELIAEQLSFKLGVDNACAKMFSMQIVDSNDITHSIDRRVDLPCNDYQMILFIIKNMLDITITASSISVNLYDIYLKQDEINTEKRTKNAKNKLRKRQSWEYAKQNRQFSKIINENELFVYNNLCEFLQKNPLDLDFYELCIVAEKANSRRLKLGNYYAVFNYAERFGELCKILHQHNIKLLLCGYCPLLLIYMIKDICNADLYYHSIDEKTLNLMNLLEHYSPYPNLELKPAEKTEYDIAVSGKVQAGYSAKNSIYIVKKAFLASDEKDLIIDTAINQIFDFGEYGINGSQEQFVAIITDNSAQPDQTEIIVLEDEYSVIQEQSYITDINLPCWVLYRNKKFDEIYSKLEFNLFTVHNSSQIKQRDYNAGGDICVISAACIDCDGNVKLDGRCRYVKSSDVGKYDISEFVQRDDVFFAAAKSTVLKVARKPKGCIPNPSTVLLVPKDDVTITGDDISYFLSPEFKSFYDVALNHQRFVLSSDGLSQYFLGKLAV